MDPRLITRLHVYRPGTHVKSMILGLYLIKDKVTWLPFMNKNTLATTRRELRKMIADEKEQRKEESILLKNEIENLKVKKTENEKKRVDLVCGKKVESFMQSFSQDTFDSLKTAGE